MYADGQIIKTPDGKRVAYLGFFHHKKEDRFFIQLHDGENLVEGSLDGTMPLRKNGKIYFGTVAARFNAYLSKDRRRRYATPGAMTDIVKQAIAESYTDVPDEEI